MMNLHDFDKQVLTIQELQDNLIPLEEKEFVSVGGGLGSFCYVDMLRVHGISQSNIAVLSRDLLPYEQFKTYCDNSGLTEQERLRSDTGARPDNCWGFPGYGLTEFIDAVKHGQIIQALRLAWQLLSEPILTDFYTPQAGHVYRTTKREADRIGWQAMRREGQALLLRILSDGRFVVLYQSLIDQSIRGLIGNTIHLSLGHNFKFDTNQSANHVYSIYQSNTDMWQQLAKKGGRVLVTGRGIAAARLIEKLLQLGKEKGMPIEVISVFRRPFDHSLAPIKQFNMAGWRLQYFNWPRAAFGGYFAEVLEHLPDGERMKLLAAWGAASTPPKRNWLKIIKKALHDGSYKVFFGQVLAVSQNDDQAMVTLKPFEETNQSTETISAVTLNADFIIECNGFDGHVVHNPFYADLIRTYRLPFSLTSGIKTNQFFEIEGLTTEAGRVFVSGVAAAGNTYGPVDSFFGQQYAAVKAVERLSDELKIKKLNVFSSFSGWIKWLLGVTI